MIVGFVYISLGNSFWVDYGYCLGWGKGFMTVNGIDTFCPCCYDICALSSFLICSAYYRYCL